MEIRDLRTKKMILWGGGYTGRYITGLLEKLNISIDGVIESNSELWGKKFADGTLIGSGIDAFCKINGNKGEYVIIMAFPQEKPYRENLIKNGFLSISWKKVVDIFVNERLEENYSIDYEAGLKDWFMNLSDELMFWETAYAAPGARKRNRYIQLAETVEFHEKYLSAKVKENDVVMDIGSGILSRYGSALDLDKKKKIVLIPVDPLAYWYNFLNEKYMDKDEISGKERISFGIFEGLSHSYKMNWADVIIVSNALDHCIDPFRSILECLKVLKVNGTLLLKHFRREAVNEREAGLHQWNMDISAVKEFVIWNRENYINASRALEKYAEIRVSGCEKDERGDTGNFGFLVIEIVKKRELDPCFLARYEKQELKEIVDRMNCIFKSIAEKDYTDKNMWENALREVGNNNIYG